MSMSPPPPPPPYPSPGSGTGLPYELASPGLRIAARLLDGLIVGMVQLVIVLAMLRGDEEFGFGGMSSRDVSTGRLFVFGLLSVALTFVYEAVVTAYAGGTPMKLAFGLKVVNAADGADIGLMSSTLRWAIPGAAALIPRRGSGLSSLITLISLVLLFADKRRQTVSDKVARTVVIRTR